MTNRKLKPKLLSFRALACLLLAAAGQAAAQSADYGKPARWEYYRAVEKDAAFLMPRLPVVVAGGDVCRGEAARTYTAYHDGVVYAVTVTSKTKTSPYCRPPKKFDEQNFAERLQKLQTELTPAPETAANISPAEAVKLTAKNRVTKLVDDYSNRRWFELAVYGADESNPKVKDFLASLKNGPEAGGLAVGDGAERTFGDDGAMTTVEEESVVKNDRGEETRTTVKNRFVKAATSETVALKVLMKPRARYSEASRQSCIQGTVVLKVAFLANGAIGEISVVRGLPSGLTEEAVKAAQKISFLPAQKDDRRFSVVKTVEYSFSIY